jgi:hypothetical protein
MLAILWALASEASLGRFSGLGTRRRGWTPRSPHTDHSIVVKPARMIKLGVCKDVHCGANAAQKALGKRSVESQNCVDIAEDTTSVSISILDCVNSRSLSYGTTVSALRDSLAVKFVRRDMTTAHELQHPSFRPHTSKILIGL